MTGEDRGSLPMWVIYEHPSDYPESFVVRRVHVASGKLIFEKAPGQGRPCVLERRTERARGNIGRQKGDDPVIREVWL
jgi:hypothetical protein